MAKLLGHNGDVVVQNFPDEQKVEVTNLTKQQSNQLITSGVTFGDDGVLQRMISERENRQSVLIQVVNGGRLYIGNYETDMQPEYATEIQDYGILLETGQSITLHTTGEIYGVGFGIQGNVRILEEVYK